MTYLTIKKLLDSSGQFPERAKSNHITALIISNGAELCNRYNSLCHDIITNQTDASEAVLRVIEESFVSSGLRTEASNAKLSNSAKKSAHIIMKAVDIRDDKSQSLALYLASRPDLLKKHKLMLEHPSHTRGKWTNWCHLDTVERSYRQSMMFYP